MPKRTSNKFFFLKEKPICHLSPLNLFYFLGIVDFNFFNPCEAHTTRSKVLLFYGKNIRKQRLDFFGRRVSEPSWKVNIGRNCNLEPINISLFSYVVLWLRRNHKIHSVVGSCMIKLTQLSTNDTLWEFLIKRLTKTFLHICSSNFILILMMIF